MLRSPRRLALLALALLVSTVAAPRARADEPSPLEAAATTAVIAAEGDAAKDADARLAVKAAMEANPKAAGPWILAARLDYAASKRTKGDERKRVLDNALKSLHEATLRDKWNVEVFRRKADVLVETKAGNDAYVEALRAAAIRAAGELLTREALERAGGGIATLRVGDPLPRLVWRDAANQDVKADDLWAKGPVIIELYRSAVWCPYCEKQLLAIDDAKERFAAEGVSVVAISPDTPETLADIQRNGLKGRKTFSLRLLSDPDGNQADRIGVRNPKTVTKDTPKDAFGLPFPTTIIVDQTGTVRFVKTHGDYRERVKPDEMLAEAKKIRLEFTPNR